MALRMALQIDCNRKRGNVAGSLFDKGIQYRDGPAEAHGADAQGVAASLQICLEFSKVGERRLTA